MPVPSDKSPLIAILTPVYNGAEFLRDCIESVLGQSYQNWRYYIVNNCSTDLTLRIAEEYASRDPRIRVTTNSQFVSMPRNFNNAFAQVPPESAYFKPVCADDWLMPDCVGRMVDFALEHPTAGVICCHQQSGERVRWNELPRSVTLLSGRDACRTALLERKQLFGAPTAFLYRTSLYSSTAPFFPNERPHADTSTCYESLSKCDYGIVHEVLAVERIHAGQISAELEDMAAGILAYLEVLFEYGPRYLTQEEMESRLRIVVDEYYRYLGGAVWKLHDARFWEFQRARATEIGLDFEPGRVARGAAIEAFQEARHPMSALRKVGGVLASRLRS